MKTKDKRSMPCITGPIELKAWLKVLNISQRKLGYECGVSQTMISFYVNCKSVSRDLEAKILNGANKMMLNYLFGVTLKVDAKDRELIVKAAEAMTNKMRRLGY